jgi:hypothetical protein
MPSFNFQRNDFPAHNDGCGGLIQPNLLGGDGFGDQIAVLTLKRQNELFIANESPQHFPSPLCGTESTHCRRDIVGNRRGSPIQGNAQHGILSHHYPPAVHNLVNARRAI